MPILSVPFSEIPQNPLPYQQEAFAEVEVMATGSTDLQELPADPTVEEGLPPHLVAEYRFARFQTWRQNRPVHLFDEKIDSRMFKFRGAEPDLVDGTFQTPTLDRLHGPELLNANRVVYPIQIRPCETKVKYAPYLTNSYMFRNETISAAYEGAGWAFPTETYHRTPNIRVHHQGMRAVSSVAGWVRSDWSETQMALLE